MNNSGNFYKNILRGIKAILKGTDDGQTKKVNIGWLLTKYLKHVSSGQLHSHNLLGHKTFFFDGPGYLHGLQEIFIDEIYNQVLPEDAFILDCGAHIGLSVVYFKSICVSSHIVCFEPDDKNFDLLQKNIASHQLKNIEAKKEAVWVEDCWLNFKQEGNMNSRIENIESIKEGVTKAIRLKDYLNKKVDFLKLDIEGAEYKVLQDIRENLHFVTNMFIEYHGAFTQNNELLEIFEIIVKAGFKFYIKEAANNYANPFLPAQRKPDYDVQLNIFCFRT
jgi:FkbM family methyltransferase